MAVSSTQLWKGLHGGWHHNDEHTYSERDHMVKQEAREKDSGVRIPLS
jgi:hypothetical protein